MKLVVLECRIANVAVYYTPDGGSSMKAKWAEKFKTLESAKDFLILHPELWMYSPIEMEFEETENELKKAGNE